MFCIDPIFIKNVFLLVEMFPHFGFITVTQTIMNWKHLILFGGIMFFVIAPVRAQFTFWQNGIEGTWDYGGCGSCNDNNPATVDSCWGGGCAHFIRKGPPLVKVDELGVGNGNSGIVWARNSTEAIRWDGSAYQIFGNDLNPGPSNSIYSLDAIPVVDSNGDPWIAGKYTVSPMNPVKFVARYTAGQWSHFNFPANNSQGNILRLGLTTSDNLWVLNNENQARFYNGQTWTTYDLTQLLNLTVSERIERIFVDDNDDLVLISSGAGAIRIYRYDGIIWQPISPFYSTSEPVEEVLTSPNGVYWVAMGNHGLMKYDGSWTRYHLSLSNFAVSSVFRITRGSGNHLWLTDKNYLVDFDGSQWTTVAKPNVYVGDGIGGLAFDQTIQTLYAARTKANAPGLNPENYGFSIFDGQLWRTSNEGASAPPLHIGHLRLSPQGDIWHIPNRPEPIAFKKHFGVSAKKSPGQAWEFAHHLGTQLTDIAWDAVGNTWFSGNGNLYAPTRYNSHALIFDDGSNLQYFNYNNAPFDGIIEIEIDQSGLVWVLDNSKDLWQYDGSNWQSFPGNYVRIEADANHGLWILESLIGFGNHVDLLYFDGMNISVKISTLPTSIGYLSDLIEADLNGGVWLQKVENELLYFDGQTTTSFPAFPTTDPHDGIKTLHIDPQNRLWVGGFAKRLYKYDNQTWDTLDFSNVPMFPDSVYSMVTTTNGEMWATGVHNPDPLDPYFGISTTVSFSILDSTAIVLDSVWPGDANDDGVANNVDILALGLAYGENGLSRPNASLNWIAQPASNWVQEFILLGDTVNSVHADTDGDGLTGINDTLAIDLNYGLTHNKTNSFSANGYTLAILPTQDSVVVGDSLEVIIQLGNALVPADSIYGIAFSVAYDAALVDSGSVQATFQPSWLGNKPTDMITLAKDFYLDDRIDLALSRTNQQDRTGYGEIARLKIIMIDDISGKNFIYDTLKLRLENVTLIGVDGQEIPYTPADAEVIVSQVSSTSVEDFSYDHEIKIYPNPTQDLIHIDFSHRFAERCELKLYNLDGSLLKKEYFFEEQKKINLADLPPGIYLLQLKIGEESYQQKVILMP